MTLKQRRLQRLSDACVRMACAQQHLNAASQCQLERRARVLTHLPNRPRGRARIRPLRASNSSPGLSNEGQDNLKLEKLIFTEGGHALSLTSRCVRVVASAAAYARRQSQRSTVSFLAVPHESHTEAASACFASASAGNERNSGRSFTGREKRQFKHS